MPAKKTKQQKQVKTTQTDLAFMQQLLISIQDTAEEYKKNLIRDKGKEAKLKLVSEMFSYMQMVVDIEGFKFSEIEKHVTKSYNYLNKK
jgi:hypothetical protein